MSSGWSVIALTLTVLVTPEGDWLTIARPGPGTALFQGRGKGGG